MVGRRRNAARMISPPVPTEIISDGSAVGGEGGREARRADSLGGDRIFRKKQG